MMYVIQMLDHFQVAPPLLGLGSTSIDPYLSFMHWQVPLNGAFCPSSLLHVLFSRMKNSLTSILTPASLHFFSQIWFLYANIYDNHFA